jgi:hypothetical protein
MDIQEFRVKRQEVARQAAALKRAQAELAQAENACNHDWSKSVYSPIRRPGYTANSGYPKGYGGSDAWMFMPVHVPATTEDRWERTCTICGRVEITGNSTEHKTSVKEPRF